MTQKLLKGYNKTEVKKRLKQLSSNDRIHIIISTNLGFWLLDRDDNGLCICNGDLILDRKNINGLPKNLVVKGNLWCNFNKSLTELPSGLFVDGHLDCYDCSLEKLPDNLYIGGNFNCSNNLLEELPTGLIVKGDLDCTKNIILDLPEDLYVGGVIKSDI